MELGAKLSATAESFPTRKHNQIFGYSCQNGNILLRSCQIRPNLSDLIYIFHGAYRRILNFYCVATVVSMTGMCPAIER